MTPTGRLNVAEVPTPFAEPLAVPPLPPASVVTVPIIVHHGTLGNCVCVRVVVGDWVCEDVWVGVLDWLPEAVWETLLATWDGVCVWETLLACVGVCVGDGDTDCEEVGDGVCVWETLLASCDNVWVEEGLPEGVPDPLGVAEAITARRMTWFEESLCREVGTRV